MKSKPEAASQPYLSTPESIQAKARQFLKLTLDRFSDIAGSDTTENSETSESSEDSETSESSESSEDTEGSETTEDSENDVLKQWLRNVLEANLIPDEWGPVVRLAGSVLPPPTDVRE
jgi:hypothetical protein